jgi:DUF1680 family protein
MRHALTSGPDEISVNLFLDATAHLAAGDAELIVTSQVRHEDGATIVALDFSDPPSRPITVRARVPEWAGRADLTVNWQPVGASDRPGFATVERTWRDGDRIEVRFPNRVRVVRGQGEGQHVVHPDDVAVFLGPRLYCLSDRHNPTVGLGVIRLPRQDDLAARVAVLHPDRLEVDGVNPAGATVRLTYSPLSATGGMPNGIGRSHPALAPPFRVWIPLQGTTDGQGGVPM